LRGVLWCSGMVRLVNLVCPTQSTPDSDSAAAGWPARGQASAMIPRSYSGARLEHINRLLQPLRLLGGGKGTTLLLPWRGSKYFVTCDSCHSLPLQASRIRNFDH
jgi:hypothetical protein